MSSTKNFAVVDLVFSSVKSGSDSTRMPDDVRSVEHRGKAHIRNGTGAGFVTADTLLAFRAALQAGLFSVLQCLRIANKRSPYLRERDVKQEKEKFLFLVRAVF